MYACDGVVEDLPRVLDLKRRYNLNIIMDETSSFASLGPYGIADHYAKQVSYTNTPSNLAAEFAERSTQTKVSVDCELRDEFIDEVDTIIASMEFACGTLGGFVVGNRNQNRDARLL